MADRDHIKSGVKEAEIYRQQGLFSQSREKYLEVLEFVEKHERYSKDKRFIESLKKKMQGIEQERSEVEQAADSPRLSPETQDLITKLFSFAKNKDMAAVEGAVALAKFGQYEKAVQEFEKLIKEGTLPLLAAKNLLQCHLTLSSPDAAISQFNQWMTRNAFLKGDLKYLRSYLQTFLERAGVKAELPQVSDVLSETDEKTSKKEDVLEIMSVGIRLGKGPKRGQTIELCVSFQSGNKVSVIISAKEKSVADAFHEGMPLGQIQCYSPLAVFNVKGSITSKSKIPSGPKQGDYALDITIEGF